MALEAQEEPESGGGLLVDLEEGARPPRSASTVAAQWFSQELFEGAEEEQEEAADPTAEAEKLHSIIQASDPAEANEAVPSALNTPQKVHFATLPWHTELASVLEQSLGLDSHLQIGSQMMILKPQNDPRCCNDEV